MGWRTKTGTMSLVLAAAVGCGGGSEGTTNPPPDANAVASVQVTPGTQTIPVGTTAQFTATARNAQGVAVSGKTPSWSTANSAVATVSQTGLVTATGAGSTTVTATVDGRAGTATVEVPDAVASVSVTPPSSSVLRGVNVQLTATARNAQGTAIPGKTFTWTSSNATVATVSTSGMVTTLAPGNVTVTASVDSRPGTASIEVVDPASIPAFQRPFAASTNYVTTNLFDHDIPQAFLDNGRMVSYWGEQYGVIGYEGHEGYDWRMPEGTPLVAVAAGTVVSTTHNSFFCPLINQQIPANGNGLLVIEHDLPGGVRVRTVYNHMSSRSVTVGQQVAAGQQVGLSGGVGCSLNPHLHFGVVRVTQTNNGQPSLIDPYGWEGPTADPWVANAAGAVSIKLWKPGEAPELIARTDQTVNTGGSNLFFGLTSAQPIGVRDAQTPNNEFVEISRDPAFAPAQLDIGGATVRTRAGTIYTIPTGVTLSAANPTIRIYSGQGSNSASTLYMGRTTPAYDNIRECIQVFNSSGALRNQMALGAGGCS